MGRGFGMAAAALLGAGLFASSVAADASTVDPIVIKGKHFFYKTNGTEFFIKGIAYQPDYNANGTASSNAGYTDPLADITTCQRDLPYLIQLSTNVVRTYALDPTKDHDACMNAFADAGIYVISDLSQPEESINRDDPSWNDDLYNRYASVIDTMSKYNNVIGFFAGNEVSNAYNVTEASAYVKAAVRDMKAYIKQQGYRQMYVGYATYDGPILMQLADYFNCGDQADAIDFWGYNIYSWCGNSNYVTSNYQARTEAFANYSVPTFFAEYGCNLVQPRTFTEVRALYGDQMTPVWSGGIVYMYFQTTNNYGLVSVNGDSVSKLVDFTYLSNELKTNIPRGTPMSEYNPASLAPQACPSLGASWMATASPLPPTPNGALCDCLVSALTCVVSDSLPDTSYGDIFSYVCGKDPNACEGQYSNATTGVYGAYSVCNNQQQLSYVMNEWYLSHGSDASACHFGGAGKIVSAVTPSGTCASLLDAAGGPRGTGTVAPPTGMATPTATGGSSSTSHGAAPGLVIPSFEHGSLSMGFSVVAAVVVGVSMLML